MDELVTDAVSGGAKVVVGGKRHARGGLFYEPTLLTNVRPTMKCASNEIFGPVAPIIRLEPAMFLSNVFIFMSMPTTSYMYMYNLLENF